MKRRTVFTGMIWAALLGWGVIAGLRLLFVSLAIEGAREDALDPIWIAQGTVYDSGSNALSGAKLRFQCRSVIGGWNRALDVPLKRWELTVNTGSESRFDVALTAGSIRIIASKEGYSSEILDPMPNQKLAIYLAPMQHPEKQKRANGEVD